MAAAPLSLRMRSTDLIKKEVLDYGGFGEVFLCYHKTLGQVALKTVYTGPLRNEESKRSLLEEGNIMAKLSHERVVKLLGVIMEDRDCSLVMELIPRGNLLAMLERVCVPVSIKGRIILEILEGMVYLTERRVIHKDIKPENILVDKDFHIKIADLGLATCQAWSKLTREESRRNSHLRQSGCVRGAGTLNYMAPEHLQSIHTPSTEKSDVYSFAIVVWVIITGKEPYENARSEDHTIQCVCNGDRPALDLIPDNTPNEIVVLMKRCWKKFPEERPTFKEGYEFFEPIYMDKLKPFVEKDTIDLRNMDKCPQELLESMDSLLLHNESLVTDGPAPLMSTETSIAVPVEASIEDLHFKSSESPLDLRESSIHSDAKACSSSSNLEEKLSRELDYHRHGSYGCEHHRDAANCCQSRHANFFPQDISEPAPATRPPQQLPPIPVSSVQTWRKAEEGHSRTASSLSGSTVSMGAYPPMSPSTSSLVTFGQHPNACYERQHSLPTYPVTDSSGPEVKADYQLNPNKLASLHDAGAGGYLHIHNASGIQIGNYNKLSILGSDSLRSVSPSSLSSSSVNSHLLEKYEDNPVTEEHLNLLRDNIGTSWKFCARRLGLTDVEIDCIEHDYARDSLHEIVYQMLERWRMKSGSVGCTIGKLCRALEGRIKADLIQMLLETCARS